MSLNESEADWKFSRNLSLLNKSGKVLGIVGTNSGPWKSEVQKNKDYLKKKAKNNENLRLVEKEGYIANGAFKIEDFPAKTNRTQFLLSTACPSLNKLLPRLTAIFLGINLLIKVLKYE